VAPQMTMKKRTSISTRAYSRSKMLRPELLVVGGGPKALALAAKCEILRELGKADIGITIIERREVGANWCGDHGYTNGLQHLGTPPEKDLGFPYNSVFGPDVDAMMLRYSWHAFRVYQRRYGEWIDRGKRHPVHKEWAHYLNWVLSLLKCIPVIGEVQNVRYSKGMIEARYATQLGKLRHCKADGIVFTGPGEPQKVRGSQHTWTENITNGKNFWQRLDVFAGLGSGNVAVIGGGETAASILLALLAKAPNLNIDLINRHGTIFTRGESYHENLMYTDSGVWKELSAVDRSEFIRRTDRGVFSVESKKTIDHAERVRFVSGDVRNLVEIGRFVQVHMERDGKAVDKLYDKVVVALGFDAFAPLTMLSRDLAPELDRQEIIEGVDEYLRVPIANNPTSGYYYYNIHMPMLAAMAQGPGFPNLSCLGTFADRVLQRYTSFAE